MVPSTCKTVTYVCHTHSEERGGAQPRRRTCSSGPRARRAPARRRGARPQRARPRRAPPPRAAPRAGHRRRTMQRHRAGTAFAGARRASAAPPASSRPRAPQKVTVQSSETSHVAVLLSAPWQSVRPRLGLWLRLAESTHHHDRSVTPSPPAPNPGSRAFLPEARRATLQAARSSAVQAPRRRSARPLQGARGAALTHARSAKNEYGANESMLRVDSGYRCGARAGRRRAPRALSSATQKQSFFFRARWPLRAREHQGLACSAARSGGQRGFAPRR